MRWQSWFKGAGRLRERLERRQRMLCRLNDLRNKEVISMKDGSRIGYVSDVELDTVTANINAMVIYGRPKWFGLFGRSDDCVIPWSDVAVIGEETILVTCENAVVFKSKQRQGFLSGLFG